jgi:hypothetical protein
LIGEALSRRGVSVPGPLERASGISEAKQHQEGMVIVNCGATLTKLFVDDIA